MYSVESMLKYLQSRQTLVSECWKEARHHRWVATAGTIVAAYALFATYSPLVRLGNWADTSKWPKLPLSCAVGLILACFAYVLIEGGYRIREKRDATIGEQSGGFSRERLRNVALMQGVEQLTKSNEGLKADIQRLLNCPADRPFVSFTAWGPTKGISAAGTEVFVKGFYLVNDGAPALEVNVEKFGTLSGFTAFGTTVARIAGHDAGFSPIVVAGVNPLLKYDLNRQLSAAWDNAFESGQVKYGGPLMVAVSVTYRDINDLWYRSVGALMYTPARSSVCEKIEFTTVKQASFGVDRPTPLQ